MKKRIAINGFGRIGRAVARIALNDENIELVAINDPSPIETTLHLFKYDSNYGRFDGEIKSSEDGEFIIVNGHKIRNFTTRNINELTWGELDIDIVLECTGIFRTQESCQAHLDSGAKKVLLSAPAKDKNFKTIVLGVNEEELKDDDLFVSNASCTTNCLAPIVKVLDDEFGVESGLMTTIHSYTNDQNVLDVGHSDLRRARAAGVNMIPTSTGAAKAVGVVLPHLDGKLNGISIRVPTPTVSIVDVVFKFKSKVSSEEVNKVLKNAADKSPDLIGFETDPLVSKDFQGDSRSTIVDASETMAVGEMVKVLSWYDNEWGYSNRLLQLAKMM
jgi:glyceraldehyde 3-phosphate dehydrogenase